MIIKVAAPGDPPPAFNPTVATIQNWLNFLGFKYKKGANYESLKADGVYGEKTESVVMDFQASEAIYSDGIVGPVTMKALERAYTSRQLEISSPGRDFTDAKFENEPLKKVLADKFEGGYDQGKLAVAAAKAYDEVRKEVLPQGVILTSSGMLRSLDAQVTASRSPVSFHYVGLALDLFIYSGMNNPLTDPYVVVRDREFDQATGTKLLSDRVHRLYARCSDRWTTNPADKPAKIELPAETEIKLPAITYKNATQYKEWSVYEKAKVPPIKGAFIDLTAIFQKHGFKRINARKSFYEGDSMMGAEWWHFQFEGSLIPKSSTFGKALLGIYSEKTLKGTPPWEQRDRVFGINWF